MEWVLVGLNYDFGNLVIYRLEYIRFLDLIVKKIKSFFIVVMRLLRFFNLLILVNIR